MNTIYFTAIGTDDINNYDLNGIVGGSMVTIVSRHKVDIKDGHGNNIHCEPIYNSLSYAYTTKSRIIKGVPKGAIIYLWDGATVFENLRPIFSEQTPRSVEDVINGLNRLCRLLSEPFEIKDLQLQMEWARDVHKLLSYIPDDYMPFRFNYKRKMYCVYKYTHVKIVHCFDDNDEYILGI